MGKLKDFEKAARLLGAAQRRPPKTVESMVEAIEWEGARREEIGAGGGFSKPPAPSTLSVVLNYEQLGD